VNGHAGPSAHRPDEARRDYDSDLPLVNTPTIQKVITTSPLLTQVIHRQVSTRRG